MSLAGALAAFGLRTGSGRLLLVDKTSNGNSPAATRVVGTEISLAGKSNYYQRVFKCGIAQTLLLYIRRQNSTKLWSDKSIIIAHSNL